MIRVIAVLLLATTAFLSLSIHFLQARAVVRNTNAEAFPLDEFLADQGIRPTNAPWIKINGAPVGNSYRRPDCVGELLAAVIDQTGDARFILDRLGEPIASNRRYIFRGRIHGHYPWAQVWHRNAVARMKSVFRANANPVENPVIAVSEAGRCELIESIYWKGYWQMTQTAGETL